VLFQHGSKHPKTPQNQSLRQNSLL
jgi:hypothetical protein